MHGHDDDRGDDVIVASSLSSSRRWASKGESRVRARARAG